MHLTVAKYAPTASRNIEQQQQQQLVWRVSSLLLNRDGIVVVHAWGGSAKLRGDEDLADAVDDTDAVERRFGRGRLGKLPPQAAKSNASGSAAAAGAALEGDGGDCNAGLGAVAGALFAFGINGERIATIVLGDGVEESSSMTRLGDDAEALRSLIVCRDAKLCLTPNGSFVAIARGAAATPAAAAAARPPLLVLSVCTLEVMASIPDAAPERIVALRSVLSMRPPIPPPVAVAAATPVGLEKQRGTVVGGGQQIPFAMLEAQIRGGAMGGAAGGAAAQYSAAASASDVDAHGCPRGDSSTAWIVAGLSDGRSAAWPVGVFLELHRLRVARETTQRAAKERLAKEARAEAMAGDRGW